MISCGSRDDVVFILHVKRKLRGFTASDGRSSLVVEQIVAVDGVVEGGSARRSWGVLSEVIPPPEEAGLYLRFSDKGLGGADRGISPGRLLNLDDSLERKEWREVSADGVERSPRPA